MKKLFIALATAIAAVVTSFADVTVASAGGAITVTVAAGTVEESAPVYLVWDTTDRGETFAAWGNSAKLGDVTSTGGAFPTTGAAHSILNGAAIRAFVMAGDKVDLYASLKKPKSVSGLVDLGYVPGKTKGTSGIDIDFKFENLSTESGVTYMFFGICDYSSAAAKEAGNSWGENFQVACDSKSGLSHQIQARPQANDHKNYKSADYTITPQNAQTLETRHVLRARTGEVPSLLLGGETVYSATSAWPNELTWDYGSGTVAVFGRNDNPPKGTDSPRYFKYGDMTLYGLRIYEKPESAHVCVRDYVPAEKDGTKGLYETISGGFYPVSADGFTLGGSATNSVFQSGAASSAATYDGGDTPEPPEPTDMSVSVTDWKGTYDGAAHSAMVTVTDPATGYTIMWDNSSTGATGPAYTDAGFYTNTFTVTATGYNDYVGTGVVEIASAPTPPEPPSGDVTVTLTTNGREITVAIAENAESVPVDVTLAWDTADRGSTLENWAHAEVIGQVTGPSGSVVVDAATYGIESGMMIRAFFGQKAFALYETLTKASTSSSVVVTDYIPGKTRKTSGIDLLATWTGTFRYGDGVSALFFGITDSTNPSNSRRFGASCGASDTADNLYTIYTWPQNYNSGRWKFLNQVASKMTTANLMKLRMGEKGTWAGVTLSNAWPADTDYDYTAPMSVFGITKVAAGGEVSTSAFGTYDLTLHALTVYEKPDTAHVVAAKYVPARSGDAYGLYNTVNGSFLPATSNDGFTPGTVTNSVTGVAFSSSAAVQVEFETADFIAEVSDAAATAFDGTLPHVTLTVTYPASADVYDVAWDWDDGQGYAHDAPASYYAVGTYTNRVKLTATGFYDFYGTGVVTIAEGTAPTGAYVDYPHAGGPVKPVNGVCGVPMEVLGWLQTWEAFPALKDAGIPYARLHDMQLMTSSRRGLFIDISNIFPVFTNDVEQAANYRFGFTDNLIAHLYRDIGVQPIFRLGVSREEFVAKGLPPLSARKPPDALKWAKICEKIILHYTQNWNNKGYTFNIPYWEIWSSPDDHPNSSSNVLWNASFDDYKAFYGTVATYLKDKFPTLKFGGYTMSDVAALSRGDTSELATYRLNCAKGFLAAARDYGWPLDFFSYRMTGDIAGIPADIAAVDSLLDNYGFTREKTQRFCAEWLPAPTEEKLGSAQQIAEIAAGLTALQQGPCDLACLYSALNVQGMYAPLFKQVKPETPRPAINCFKAYHELRKLGTAVRVRNLPAGVFATAASDGGMTMKLLIANVSGAAWTPTLAFAPWTVVSAINVSNWTTASLPAGLPNNSVWLLTLNLND